MPHLILDYSSNLSSSVQELKIAEALHQAMMTCGLFAPDAVKTRCYAASDFLVGPKGHEGKFIHASVAILSGRTGQQRKELSDLLLSILKDRLPHVDSLTVEIREMDKASYGKAATL